MHPYRLLKNLTGSRKFLGSRMKIARARQHISEISTQWGEWCASGPFVHRVLHEPKAGEQLMMVSLPPPLIPAILGDAAHNMRSALDHLAADLMRLEEKSVSGVYFPLAVDELQFEKALASSGLRTLRPEIVDAIRASQPFSSTNDRLFSLHEMNKIDKHRSLLLCAVHVSVSRMQMTLEYLYMKIGDAIGGSTSGADYIHEEVQGPLLLFPSATTLEGREVIPTLNKVVDSIDEIVTKFELVAFA